MSYTVCRTQYVVLRRGEYARGALCFVLEEAPARFCKSVERFLFLL